MSELKQRPSEFINKYPSPALLCYIDFFEGNKSFAHKAFIEDLAGLLADDEDVNDYDEEDFDDEIDDHDDDQESETVLKPRPADFIEKTLIPVLNAYIDFFDGNKSFAHEAFIEDVAALLRDDDEVVDFDKYRETLLLNGHILKGYAPTEEEKKAVVLEAVMAKYVSDSELSERHQKQVMDYARKQIDDDLRSGKPIKEVKVRETINVAKESESELEL